MTPCSCSHCSGSSASVRSRRRRACGSVSRICAFLVVGERENTQRENFVDLGAIEESARALGRDLRIVVKDDGRREHGIGRRGARRPIPATDRRSSMRRRIDAVPPADRATMRIPRPGREGWRGWKPANAATRLLARARRRSRRKENRKRRNWRCEPRRATIRFERAARPLRSTPQSLPDAARFRPHRDPRARGKETNGCRLCRS